MPRHAPTLTSLLGPLRPALALALVLGASCSDRPTDDPEELADASTGDAGEPVDQPITATGGTEPDDDEADETTAGADESTGVDPVEPDPCEPHWAEHWSEEQTCGLTEVRFDFQSSELDFAARCQLELAAPCIASEPDPLYLKAHASTDEGRGAPDGSEEEANLALSQARGVAVEAFLAEQGVPPESMVVIAQGSLGPRDPESPESRRVVLEW